MSVEVDKICRTCLGLTGPLLSIYDGDANSCVAEMLRDFTKMKPTPTDNMPSKVCLTCISEINHCFSFKMKCENSNRTLRQLIPEAMPEEQSQLPSTKSTELSNKCTQTASPIKVQKKSIEIQTVEQELTNVRQELEEANIAPVRSKRKFEMEASFEEENTFVITDENNSTYAYEESHEVESAPEADENILPDPTVRASLKCGAENFNNYAIQCVENGNEYVVELKHLAEMNANENIPVELDNMLVTPLKHQPPRDGAAVYEITQVKNSENRNSNEFQDATLENVEDEGAAFETHNTIKNTNQKIVDVLYDAKRKRTEYKCSECPQTFISLNVLRRHLTKFHDLYVSEEIITKTQQPNVMQSPAVLPDYLNAERLHFCRQCNASFTTKRSMDLHIKKNVCNMQCHTCAICERVFKTTEQLESHTANEHVTKTISCLDCSETFATQVELTEHQVQKHKRSLQNQCNICKKVFTMVSTLKDHLRIHTGEKPFQCTVCNKSFSQKSNLKQHMQRHQNAKNFKCTLCGDSFVTRSELFSHQRKHSGAQPFKCDFCTAAFSTNSTLKKHRRQHTGERPYACDICPMRFAALNVLKNHRRIHTGEKPFACPVCKKTFTQQGDCTIHLKTHDSAKNHYCICGKEYPIPSRLAKHQKICKYIKTEIEIDEDAPKSSDEAIAINLAKMCDD